MLKPSTRYWNRKTRRAFRLNRAQLRGATRSTVEQLESRTMLSGTNPAQTIDTSLTPAQLAQSLVGAGVSVSNVTFSGGAASTGSFDFSDPKVVGFDKGILLSSGSAADVVGPNLSDWTSTDFGRAGDADLTTLSGYDTHDAAVLEFDFTPTANQVVFNYTFASDEYPEWVSTPYNDVFGFFVNGKNYAEVRQVAGDPSSPFVPVAINNINNSNPVLDPPPAPMRPDLFRANYYVDPNVGPSAIDLELDGITNVLTFQAPVIPGEINHMKLAIADASDGIYDSAVFIQAGSLVSNTKPVADLSLAPTTGSAPLKVTAFVEGEDPNGLPLTYSIDWGDNTVASTGDLNQPANENEKTTQVDHTFAADGTYVVTLTVSNGQSSVTSTEDVEVSTVLPAAPKVIMNPVDQTVLDGDTFTLTASASGVPQPGVQWQKSTDGGATFVNIPGATGTSYSATASLDDHGNQYHAVFTNSEGSATTSAAVLTVTAQNSAPKVTNDPTDQIVTEGQTFTFTASATGVPTPTVKWQVSTNNGVSFDDIAGATEVTYSATATMADDGKLYRAVFINGLGSATTKEASLTVTSVDVAPVVTAHPTDQTALEGETFTFTASATGVPAPSVQWQVLTNGGTNFVNIPGATDVSYSATASVDDDGNQYRAVFTNSRGSATTASAALTVVALDKTPPAAPGVALTQDTGASDTDHITSVGTLALSDLEPGALVEYSVNGGTIWSDSFIAIEGLNDVLVRQTDPAGNVSDATPFSFVLDKVAKGPRVDLMQDTGSSATDHLTNVGTLAVSGVEANAVVEYSVDGGAKWTGDFQAIEGVNNVLVRQTDLAGNVSAETPFTFTLDTTPPTLSPTFSSTPPFLVGTTGITVSPNATDASGIASQSAGPVDTSTAGKHTVTSTATDNAGNVASVDTSYVVGYTLTLVSPAAGATFKHNEKIPVSFQLSDANGVISDAAAASLLPGIGVTFDGLPATDVKYDKKSNNFSAKLKTGKPAAGVYDVTINVAVGGAEVAKKAFPVNVV